MLKLTKVESSNLNALGHDAASGMLLVEFKAKKPGEAPRLYLYEGVPEETYQKILKAESCGKAFITEVQKKPFRYAHVTQGRQGLDRDANVESEDLNVTGQTLLSVFASLSETEK
jgi:hypothetical protein